MKEIYKIQTSNDGKNWKTEASFKQGDISRFERPFSFDVAKMELQSFNKVWFGGDTWVKSQRNFKRSRLIVEVY